MKESDITHTAAYCLIGGLTSASINGSVVNFSTTTVGQAYGVVAIADDMAADINAGNNNIEAGVNSGNLVLREMSGGSITIVNTSTIQKQQLCRYEFMFTTPPSMKEVKCICFGTRKTRRWRTYFTDVVGSTTNDFGILSGHTGSYVG